MVYWLIAAKEALKVASCGATQVYGVSWHPGQGDVLACATSTGGKIINMERPGEAVHLGTDSTKWVTWSTAGDLLITVGEQNVVWNSHGARVATLQGQPGNCQDPQFNASGSLVAITRIISVLMGYCDVFHPLTGILVHFVEYFALLPSLQPIVWKDDLEFFCISDMGNTINHWRVGQAEPLRIMSDQILTTTIAFNPEKDILAFGGHNGTIGLWSSGITKLTGHTRRVIGVVWTSQNSGIVASYSLDGQVRIWDAIEETNLHVYEGYFFTTSNYGMSQISFSPDGRFFAAASRYQNVKVVKVSTAETVAKCEENGIAVSWSRGSNKLAVKTIRHPNIVDGVVTLVEEAVSVEEAASVYNLENLVGINLKTMSMKCVASLLQKNLTNGKEEAEEFLTNERIPKGLISGVCSYLN